MNVELGNEPLCLSHHWGLFASHYDVDNDGSAY